MLYRYLGWTRSRLGTSVVLSLGFAAQVLSVDVLLTIRLQRVRDPAWFWNIWCVQGGKASRVYRFGECISESCYHVAGWLAAGTCPKKLARKQSPTDIYSTNVATLYIYMYVYITTSTRSYIVVLAFCNCRPSVGSSFITPRFTSTWGTQCGLWLGNCPL